MQETKQGVYIWRGFEHIWKRRVATCRVPHRISKFHSFIDDETHHLDAQNKWHPRAIFQFGQSTGVDGNFMQPIGFYQKVMCPDITAHQGSTSFNYSDTLKTGDYPIATSTHQRTIRMDLAKDQNTAIAILRGIRLDMKCDPNKQPADRPCNSHGMWPSWFQVSIGPVNIEDNQAVFTVSIKVHRAWTPHLGGLPPIEIKPLNVSLDFDFEVMWTLIGASTDQMHITHGTRIERHHHAQQTHLEPVISTIAGAPDKRHAVSALAGFGFELSALSDAKKQKHAGRYIDIWCQSMEDKAYNTKTGIMTCIAQAQVGVPKTVVDAQVHTWLEPVLLQFEHEDTQIEPAQHIQGQLCANSVGAPFFSTWQKCGDAEKGPEQRENTQHV